ncbi:hypothetical protein OSB04_010146 [Centaurea solstitialis]|uniref:Leucine-rich repeat-containing N-terminal plant-type domain-containing protein n=1 Tax=Centaurea solstitialis TaxID=347529 RepID=A0AA38WBM0_9ASTR|nr:hypothetical protein OSB04_010146 [Centaurea solstitialis]
MVMVVVMGDGSMVDGDGDGDGAGGGDGEVGDGGGGWRWFSAATVVSRRRFSTATVVLGSGGGDLVMVKVGGGGDGGGGGGWRWVAMVLGGDDGSRRRFSATMVVHGGNNSGGDLLNSSNQLAEAAATTYGNIGANAINKKSCFHKEKQALLHFKASISRDRFGTLSTWRAEHDGDCCNWSGVTCNNQTHHVTELHLRVFLLEGEISPSLVNLTYLNQLDLSYNSFNGTIPNFIGSMTQLRYLDLSANSFNATIPNFIGSMTQLRYLDLSYNFFNGTIPKSIGSLTQLRYLDLSYNFLHGNIPPEFGNLISLRNLSLGTRESSSMIEIENLDWLSNLSRLQHLQMERISLAKANYWIDVILSLRKLSFLSLWKCDLSQIMHPYSSFLNSSSSSIEYLYLRNSNLNSSMYHWLFPLTGNRLLFLDLSYNMIDGVPKYLGNLCSLTDLYLESNQIAVKFADFLNNLSGCTSVTLRRLIVPHSQFTGSVSDEIQKFSSLEFLYLSHNHLSGTMSEKVWELRNLQTLDVSSNSLVITANVGKSKILYIDLSNNSLVVTPSEAHMSNNYCVESIDLRACNLGPLYPKLIQTYKNLTYLDISGNRIFDTIHVRFWKTWPSRLRYLNISSNNISGKVPDLSSNFDIYPTIDLSSNNFYGPIPNVPSTLRSLNLSKNKFYGGITFLCQIVDGFLSFLDLSHNSLTGKLPDCLWHFKELQVLNLGHNNFSGRLPASIGYLFQLQVLDLYNNSFSRELPLALKNCTSLTFLNLGANKFSSYVPIWIGENLIGLYGLILRSNNFFGPIPLQLCHLVNLQILDLSMNNLNGTIPPCVNNLSAMVHGRLLLENNMHRYAKDLDDEGNVQMVGTYVDNAIMEWRGNERELTSTLGLLTSIDLSSNNLTGQIPNELTDLHELLALNLSKNALLGEIPRRIGEMKKLEIFDLSRNNFSGGIPSSMSQTTSLNWLDVSYNKLSGRIPSSTQLQSFEPSTYIGNAGLCGPPITKSCPGDEVPSMARESESGEESIDELRRCEKSIPAGEAEAKAETRADHESSLFSETIAGLLKREPENKITILVTSLGHQFVAAAVDANVAINYKCFHKERQALLDFKAGVQDPDGQLSTWRAEDENCCKWSGVTCNNQTLHLTELHLSSYHLAGKLSPSLLNLSHLNHLELSHNLFNGSIPDFIGSMTQLTYLGLSRNSFNGTIPMSVGSLTQLRYLDLSYTFFVGTIPPKFGNLTNLRNLSLGNFFDTSPMIEIENLDWLSNLSHLQHLQMDGVSLAKANHWVDVVLGLPKLSSLSLWECDLSKVMHPYSSFMNYSSSSSIEYLYLGDNNLNSSTYPWLFPLTSNRLLELDLSYNMLDGIPKYLGDLCSLTDLYLYSNHITIKFADFLSNLSGCTSVTLRRLSAWDSQFTGSVSDEIQKFSSLELLDLSDNQLSGTMSEKVWELPNLQNLYVSSNSLVITTNVGKSKISYIDLSNNLLVVTPSEPHMSNNYCMESIDLRACNLGPLYPKWIQRYKNLTYLDISDNQIFDTIPVLFWRTWPSRLRYLNLSSNNINGKVPNLSLNFDIYPTIDLSSNNFYGPIPNVPSTLTSLNLSKNKFYGGISFLCQIVDGFLTFLDLSHNSLTGQLPDCLWHFKELQVLNLGHNNFSGRLPASIGYLLQLQVIPSVAIVSWYHKLRQIDAKPKPRPVLIAPQILSVKQIIESVEYLLTTPCVIVDLPTTGIIQGKNKRYGITSIAMVGGKTKDYSSPG